MASLGLRPRAAGNELTRTCSLGLLMQNHGSVRNINATLQRVERVFAGVKQARCDLLKKQK